MIPVGIPFDEVMKKSIGYYVANLVFNGDLIPLDNFGSWSESFGDLCWKFIRSFVEFGWENQWSWRIWNGSCEIKRYCSIFFWRFLEYLKYDRRMFHGGDGNHIICCYQMERCWMSEKLVHLRCNMKIKGIYPTSNVYWDVLFPKTQIWFMLCFFRNK